MSNSSALDAGRGRGRSPHDWTRTLLRQRVGAHSRFSGCRRSWGPMTPLRQKLIDEIQLRGYSQSTQTNYVHWVAKLAQAETD